MRYKKSHSIDTAQVFNLLIAIIFSFLIVIFSIWAGTDSTSTLQGKIDADQVKVAVDISK